MNSFAATSLLAALAIAAAFSGASAMDEVVVEPWRENPLVAMDEDLIKDLRRLRRDVRDQGCNVNLCFNVQGDNTLSTRQFQTQLDFVSVLTRLVRNGSSVQYAGVQYAITTTPISQLTNNSAFATALASARQSPTEPSNIAAALGYCGFELRSDQSNTPGFVVWIGTDAPSVGFAPKVVARQINEDGFRIIAVAVGNYDSYDDVNEIAGRRGTVLTPNNFSALGGLIEGIARKVCDLQS